jgi:hypothetical protein
MNAELRQRRRGDALEQSPLRTGAREDANAHEGAEETLRQRVRRERSSRRPGLR